MAILQANTKIQSPCYHCGEHTESVKISSGDKIFCCQGCRIVYELLSENKLHPYYALEDHPGLKADQYKRKETYSFLDDQITKGKLLDFTDGAVSKMTFRIPQMHCSACIWLLENLHKLDAGIGRSRVNFLRKELSLTYFEKKTSLRRIVELLAEIGYAPELQLDRLDQPKKKSSSQKSLYIELGIAGFAFGNIMLFSLPEYLDIRNDLSGNLRLFFGYLNILLALPVLFYSSRSYFISGLAGIRQRVLNIDVPISLGILALFLRSIYEILSANGTGYLDSFAGLVFFLLIGKVFQQKTYEALAFDRDYKSYFPISVTKKENRREKTIPLSDLRIGDRILIHSQELIPADSALLSTQAFIDYSFVTGESAPVKKRQGDLLFAGGRQVGPAIEAQVIKEVSQSYLTSLWNNEIFQKPPANALRTVADTIGKYFTLAVLSIAIFAAIFWLVVDASHAPNAFTAVLIIACPCALALSIPFTFGNALRILGKNQFYLKNTDAVASLAKIDTIVFDKTGTLTYQGKVDVAFLPVSKKRFAISRSDNNSGHVVKNGEYPFRENAGSQNSNGVALSSQEKRLIASLVRHSTHPLSYQISKWLAHDDFVEVEHFQEVQGAGIEGIIEKSKIRIGAKNWILPHEEKQGESPRGKTTQVFLEIDGTIRGYFIIANNYRPKSSDVLAELQRRFEVYLLSGDNDSEKRKLEELFGGASTAVRLHFNQSPGDKLQFIRRLQAQGRRVLMIGDGLNDAGALKQSDAGVSISEDLTAFSPACDGILDARQFGALDKILRFSRLCMKVVFACFCLSFLYNIIGLSFAISGTLSPLVAAILMPVSSISVVAFATLATRWQGKRLAL